MWTVVGPFVTSSVTEREGLRVRMFENRVLGVGFGRGD